MKRKKVFKVILFWIVLLIFFTMPVQPATAKQANRYVKIAYPIQVGLTEIDENGNYTGYTYEYLEELAQYTGWDYEYIQMEGDLDNILVTMMDMLQSGEIDLMGGMLYSESMAEIYDYSSYSYGQVETVLQALSDDPRDLKINSQIEQTFRIAVIEGAKTRNRELSEYCENNLINVKYVYCENDAAQLEALKEGRADLLLSTSMYYMDGVRTIARFSQKPVYFITGKGKNSDLLHELDEALSNIDQTDPYFMTRMIEKYFGSQNTNSSLSESELSYIEKHPILKVGVLTNDPPYQWLDERTKAAHGISVSLIEMIGEKTGFQIEYVWADDFRDLKNLANLNQIDMIARMGYDYDLARSSGLAMSRSYLSTQYVLLVSNSYNEDKAGKRMLALSLDLSYLDSKQENVLFFSSYDECVEAVVKGKADFTYMDNLIAQLYVEEYGNDVLRILPQFENSYSLCFGVDKPVNVTLLNIVNKIILNLSDEEKQAIIYQNTLVDRKVTLSNLIRTYPKESMMLAVCVLLLVVGGTIYFTWRRDRRNRATALELKKHLQVYQMLNDYFFEYNYEKQTMIISVPDENMENNARIEEFDFSVLETSLDQEHSNSLKKLILSRQEGIHEIFSSYRDEEHWLRVALKTIMDDEGNPVYAVGKITIIDDEIKEKELLLNQAQRDSLTHILNTETSRRMIIESMKSLKSGEHGGLILLDVDNFKEVNDTYGHLIGDQMLNEVAKTLQNSFRENDVVGRLGGDEFVVYMTKINSRKELAAKCESVCQKFREVYVEENRNLTISIGAALTSAGDDFTEIFQKTDNVLYLAKKQGRDQWVVLSDDNEESGSK